MSEAGFLDAIQADPRDTTTRLVYADWLDERDDPRGELIRIEEEMHQVPVFADRFWELKPRRNKVRSQASPDWLGAMGYGTVVHPVFRHGWPDGVKPRWRLIRELIERWHRVSLPDAGGRQTEIAEAQTRLGRTLPESVREWIALAHDLKGDNDELEVLRDFFTLEEMAGQSAVSLLIQGEGDYQWAVGHADLGRADPPVQGFSVGYDDDEQPLFDLDPASPVAADLTSFVRGYALGYTDGQSGFGKSIVHGRELLDQLIEAFPVHLSWGTTEIFEAEDVLVLVHDWRESHHRSWHLYTHIARANSREAIPPFLWEHARGAGSFWGMFIPEELRQRGLPPPSALPGEDIPF